MSPFFTSAIFDAPLDDLPLDAGLEHDGFERDGLADLVDVHRHVARGGGGDVHERRRHLHGAGGRGLAVGLAAPANAGDDRDPGQRNREQCPHASVFIVRMHIQNKFIGNAGGEVKRMFHFC
ncbi:MAG: hypothetical protein QM770_25050 [Tepidisphaeraceae bacterium]